jgi:exodeoxyribonuclease VII large subunit
MEDLWAFNDEAVARAIAASPVPVICGVGHETDFTIADLVSDLRAPTPTAAAELATPNQADLVAALQESTSRLGRAAQILLNSQHWQLTQLESRLRQHSPRARLFTDRQRLDDLIHRAGLGLRHNFALQRAHLAGLDQRLKSLNPQQVLQRGYAILKSPDGRTIRSVDQVHPGDLVTATISDGELGLTVQEINPHAQ